MLMVGGSTLKSCGSFDSGWRIARFDLLLNLDAIKLLGGMSLTSPGEVKFPWCDEPTCAAITINEPDFSADRPHPGNVLAISHQSC